MGVLLGHFRDSIKPKPKLHIHKRTLCTAIDVAYEPALVEHHIHPLKKTVRAATTLLPAGQVHIYFYNLKLYVVLYVLYSYALLITLTCISFGDTFVRLEKTL